MALPVIFHNQGRGRPIGGGAVPAPAPPFSPTDLSGLVLWLDGLGVTYLYQDSALSNPVVSDGDVVGGWKDRSSSNNNAIQATTARKPTYDVSAGVTGVEFDSVSSQFMNLNNVDGKPVTIMAVVTRPHGGNNTVIGGTGGFFQYRISSNEKSAYLVASVVLIGESDSVVPDGNRSVVGMTYSAAGAFEFWLNGSSDGSGTNDREGFYMTDLGGKGGTSENFHGVIHELVVYDSVLSNDNISTLHTYLSNRWSVS